MADQLINRFIDHALGAWTLPGTGLDSTTLGKPSGATLARTGHVAIPAIPLQRSTQFRPQATPKMAFDPLAENCRCPVLPRSVEAKTLVTHVDKARTLFESSKEWAMDNAKGKVPEFGKAAAAFALCAMLIAQPAHAAGIDAAVKDFTDAAYPIIGGLKKEVVAPLTGKALAVALTASPKEIIKTIDLGLDAFLSTPPEKFLATVKALKAATAEAATASSCNLVCLPSLEAAEKVGAAAADALGSVDKEKLKAFTGEALTLVNSVDKLSAVGVLADGSKFAASLDPGAVAKASGAALEILKASS